MNTFKEPLRTIKNTAKKTTKILKQVKYIKVSSKMEDFMGMANNPWEMKSTQGILKMG